MAGDNQHPPEALEDRVRFESLVADLISHFVNLDAELIDDAIQAAQRRLVEALDLDRSALFQVTDGLMQFTHAWSTAASPSLPDTIVTSEMFPWTLSHTLRGEIVAIAKLDEIPNPIDRRSLETIGTRSLVSVPLKVSGQLVGALSFGSVRKERSWPPELINRLCLIANVFAGALARKRADIDLRHALDDNAALRERLTEENSYLQHEVKTQQGPSDIAGASAPVERLRQQIAQVSPTSTTVLLLGETGTGKELAATEIHDRSPRAKRPMVSVHCAAIPSSLIESELFGAEKGAYTGAHARQIGRFELADGSTIFLDEVGELPPDMQVKLLRVVQEREIQRLGNPRPMKIDVRVIAATNRDLEREVAEGRFRADLFYRLNVFPITVPPLRERAEDIPELVRTFVDELSKPLGKKFDAVAKDKMLALQRHSWPGNVRELRNVIERAVIICAPPRLVPEIPRSRLSGSRRHTKLSDVEREHLLTVLERTHWRVRGAGGAAELLGLKPSTLEGRLAKLGIRRPR